MEKFSSEYIINFLAEKGNILVITLDHDQRVMRVFGDEMPGEDLLSLLKSKSKEDRSRLQYDGSSYDVWCDRDEKGELYVLNKVDDKAELEKRVLDASFIKDTEIFYKELLHEIRTPLGTMRNYLYIVTEEMKRFGGGRRKTDVAFDNLEAIHDEIMRVDSLLHTIDGISKGGEIEEHCSDLGYETRFMEKIYRKIFEVKGVSFTVISPDDGLIVSAPPRAIRQALSNLITNALEGVKENGSVVVEATCSGEQRGVIEVRDNGVGIDKELKLQLFKEPVLSEKGEGRGFGLWIAGKVIERYGGKIEYRRGEEGSIFRVEFPVNDGGMG